LSFSEKTKTATANPDLSGETEPKHTELFAQKLRPGRPIKDFGFRTSNFGLKTGRESTWFLTFI
jgi:hypothetical protein